MRRTAITPAAGWIEGFEEIYRAASPWMVRLAYLMRGTEMVVGALNPREAAEIVGSDGAADVATATAVAEWDRVEPSARRPRSLMKRAALGS